MYNVPKTMIYNILSHIIYRILNDIKNILKIFASCKM